MLPQPASAPRRSLGTSGVFFVEPLSPSIEALRTQALAAQHATRQIHGDRNLGEAESIDARPKHRPIFPCGAVER